MDMQTLTKEERLAVLALFPNWEPSEIELPDELPSTSGHQQPLTFETMVPDEAVIDDTLMKALEEADFSRIADELFDISEFMVMGGDGAAEEVKSPAPGFWRPWEPTAHENADLQRSILYQYLTK